MDDAEDQQKGDDSSTAATDQEGRDQREDQWLAKALELAAKYGAGDKLPIEILPTASPSPLPLPPAVVMLPAPSGPERVPSDSQPGQPASEKVEVNLVEAIEQYGLCVIPAWYVALDKIYELSEMKDFSTAPEPLATVPGLTGVPGFSFVVPKTHPRNERSIDNQPALVKLSESMLRRYENRLVGTQLSGTPQLRAEPELGVDPS